MNYCFNLPQIKIFISIIIIAVNIFLVAPKLVEIKNNDPKRWSADLYAEFNNVFAISIDDEYLSNSTDPNKCNANNQVIKNVASDPNYWNACPGIVHSCWINEEPTDKGGPVFEKCFCLCEHTKDFKGAVNTASQVEFAKFFNLPRPKLLDSICFDPIVLEGDFVVTGVRFRQYANRLHLEVQKGILRNGGIDEVTVDWNIVTTCKDSRKILKDFSGSNFRSIRIPLQDITLDEYNFVTGVKFGESLLGQSADVEGNLNSETPSKNHYSVCLGSTTNVLQNYKSLRQSTSASGDNQDLSESCHHHIEFRTTTFDPNYQQHVVPYVDLQEVVTKPPMPISGIGWYYRGYRKCGGFLALKIFTLS